MATQQKRVLGRGLGALIPQKETAPATPGLMELAVDQISPNPYQPRKIFNEASIEELARSVREHGIVQPLVVTRSGDKFKLIAGERRFRAAQRAGLLTVPVVVKDDLKAGDALEIALIENIQREDLNPIEEALAYRKLGEDYHLTQEQIADAVGKDRSSVANYVRLLKLPQEVRSNVGSGALSMGHARAILGLADDAAQLRVSREVVSKNLSVRETEALVKKATQPATEKKEAEKDVHTRAAEEKLRFALGTRARIVRKGKGGRIEIDFTSEDELNRLYEQLTDK